jgi:hypothetical protein
MRGETARAILAQYYPGLELTPLSGMTIPVDTLTAAPQPAALPRRSATGTEADVVAPRARAISVMVPPSSPIAAFEIERMAASAHEQLARTLGTSVLPMTIRLHDTLDSFRLATNRPWWVSEVAEGTLIDLAPAAVLAQRGGIEASVRMAVAELLVAGPLAGRAAWVRIGAARYFSAGDTVRAVSALTRCPSDAELLLAVSAPAQRDAEGRAEGCFARALATTRDWRSVR